MSKTTHPLHSNATDDVASEGAASAAAQPSTRPTPAVDDPRALIRASDPHDLVGELDGTRLRLTWQWPDSPLIQVCVVVWRTDHWPELPDERDAHVVHVARRTYDSQGFFSIDVPADLPQVYVRIYAALLEARRPGYETWLYSPGLEPTTRKLVPRSVAVLSRFHQRRGRTPPALELYTIDGSPLPRLEVRRDKTLPLRVTEGISVARYPGGTSPWMLVLAESERWTVNSWISVFSSMDGIFWRAERCALKLDRQG
jgi:hypothetical protein